MGEEEKKEAKPKEEEMPKEEAKKEEEAKEAEKPKEDGEKGKEGSSGEEKKDGKAAAAPPPEEVVMRVYMHCEGCARKVKKILKGFDGVEDVIADSKAHKVLVKGKKAAMDPMKVVERVQKKTGRKVELLSPIPPPPEEKEEEKKEPEPLKPEEKEPPVISVVLKVHMHCEACAQGIKKRILKMKGVQSAEPDLKASEVTVKGVFEEAKLAEYVHKRTGKHAAIIKSEPVAPPEKVAAEGGNEKKPAEGGDEKKEEKEEKKDGKDEGGNGGGDEKKEEKEKEGGNADGEEKDKDKEKDPATMAVANLYQHHPRFAFPTGYYPPGPGYAYLPPYPPSYQTYPSHPSHNPSQIFSDENPNACSVM